MARHKLQHVPDDQVVDLSSDEEIERLTNNEYTSETTFSKTMVKRMITKSEEMLTYIPGSPAFMKGVVSDGFKRKSKLFGFKQRTEKKLQVAVEECRALVNGFIDEKARDPRKQLKKHMERFPDSPDLHALWAIYLFNYSTSRSQKEEVSRLANNRMDEDKVKRFRKCLLEMISVFNSDCLNVYYVTWFIQIYNEYLAILKRMFEYTLSIISHESDKRFEEIVRKVFQGHAEVEAMILKKEDLESFNAMGRMVSNSNFAILNLTHQSIKETFAALEKIGEEQLSAKLNVNNIINMLMNILLLFAKIPVMTQQKYVFNFLKGLPNLGDEMEMRKKVILSAQYVNNYKMAAAIGDLSQKRSTMRTVYKYCLDIVQNDMDQTVPTRWHANIIMRLGWVVINSSDQAIFEKEEFEKILRQAYQYLNNIVINCTVPTNPKRKETSGSTDLKQSMIEKALKSRSKIVDVGKAQGFNLDDL